MTYKEQIDFNRLPQHIAIIMDGNGRWAKKKGLPRVFGHKRGGDTVHHITEECVRLGVKYLTLYAFSLENWNRPKDEVDALMNILVDTIEKERKTLMDNNVRLMTIGNTSLLPERVQSKFKALIDETSVNTGMSMVLALSYSSRWEITEASRKIAEEVASGKLQAADINEEVVSQHMCTSFMPDPELLIRTSGELRISNYLLWQLAYSELYFTECSWPEFDENELHKAIVDYQQRERRFGLTSEQVSK